MSQANEDNLIWIDLEMTGLDTDADSILEIATIVTDKDLRMLAEGPVFAIRHPLERLEGMDAWNRNQHRKSGLWDQVVASADDHADGRAGDAGLPAGMGAAGQVADVRQLDLPGPPLPASADAAAGALSSTTAISTCPRSRSWRGAGRRRSARVSARSPRIRRCRISAIRSTNCATTASSWASWAASPDRCRCVPCVLPYQMGE